MNAAMIKPQWGPLTIALMVLGFVVFWPLGLAMLAYILWGEMFGGTPERAQAWMDKSRTWCRDQGSRHHSYGNGNWRQSSGNAAFDDYRAEQLKRLDEERRRLDEDVQHFHEYLRTLRMARDREEFDRFMRERNGNRPSSGGDAGPTN
ncbi:MAG: DUF2852 domain-containing protein [Devosia sp.]